MAGAGDQVGIGKAFTDLDSLRGGCVCRLCVQRGKITLRARQKQVSLLGTGTPIPSNEALGTREPSRGGTSRAAKKEAETYPESAACCTHALADLKKELVGAFERTQIVVFAPHEICTYCEQMEITGA